MSEAMRVKRLMSHPAHWLALGFGSGLSPLAPGTVGTLWAWVSFLALQPYVPSQTWGWICLAGVVVGWWACALTAFHLRVADPSTVVWDEIVAFWLVLWIITPCHWGWQLVAFALFRWLDALKPGPVGWADTCFAGAGKAEQGPDGGLPSGGMRWADWLKGWGILWDDLVAAACTLLLLALVWRLGGWGVTA